jgi:hypothetical protein
MARLHDRTRKGGSIAGSPGLPTVEFSSTLGVSPRVDSTKVEAILREYPTVVELGHLGVHNEEGIAGNAATTITVPDGVYWRLLGIHTTLITDGNAADRVLTIEKRDAEDAEIYTIEHEIVTASTTAKRTTLFGTNEFVVGNEAVKATGTLTVDTVAAEDEVIVINGITFTWKDALTGATANELLVNTDEAGTKATLEAAFVSRTGGGTLHTVSDATYALMECTAVAFDGDAMVFTANWYGAEGNAIATTTTMSGGNNAWGAAVLENGMDAADQLGKRNYPRAGALLGPGQDVYITVDAGVAGDTLDILLFYLEMYGNPVP